MFVGQTMLIKAIWSASCVKQGCVHSMCPNYKRGQMMLNNTLTWIHDVKILIWKVIEVNFTLDLHTIVNYLVNWPWGKQTYLMPKNNNSKDLS